MLKFIRMHAHIGTPTHTYAYTRTHTHTHTHTHTYMYHLNEACFGERREQMPFYSIVRVVLRKRARRCMHRRRGMGYLRLNLHVCSMYIYCERARHAYAGICISHAFCLACMHTTIHTHYTPTWIVKRVTPARQSPYIPSPHTKSEARSACCCAWKNQRPGAPLSSCSSAPPRRHYHSPSSPFSKCDMGRCPGASRQVSLALRSLPMHVGCSNSLECYNQSGQKGGRQARRTERFNNG